MTSLDGLLVLIVDDQEDSRSLVTYVLEACGARVHSCESACEALKAIVECQPDVIVSDIGMPERDGYWLIENVRRLEPEQGGQTPAIALTAHTRPEDRRRVIAAGFQMHIGKPFEPEQVVSAIGAVAVRIDPIGSQQDGIEP